MDDHGNIVSVDGVTPAILVQGVVGAGEQRAVCAGEVDRGRGGVGEVVQHLAKAGMVVERAGADAHVVADAIGQLAGDAAEVAAGIADVVVDQGRAARLAASVAPGVAVAAVAADIDAASMESAAHDSIAAVPSGAASAAPPSPMPPQIARTTPQANRRLLASPRYAPGRQIEEVGGLWAARVDRLGLPRRESIEHRGGNPGSEVIGNAGVLGWGTNRGVEARGAATGGCERLMHRRGIIMQQDQRASA